MDAYIVKPVNVDELLRVLKDIMLQDKNPNWL
jgi:hypothetical protein